MITFTYPEDRRPEMKGDVLALGFVTNKDDAVLVRVDSGTSNDYLELEIVSYICKIRIMIMMDGGETTGLGLFSKLQIIKIYVRY